MRRALALAALGLVLALGHACVRPAGGPTPTLADVVSSFERETAPFFPFAASERGSRQYDRVLANDISEEYRRGLKALCVRHREDLRRVDASALSPADRLTHDILAHRLETCVEGFDFAWHLLPVNQVGFSLPSRFPIMGAGKGIHPFRTVRNYEDFLGRVDGFVIWMDTAIANMRLGLERGIVQPREVMLRVIPQLDAHIVDDPQASLFYEPIRSFPAEIDAGARRRLDEEYRGAIRDRIVPAYRRLRAFLHDEYLPRCRTSYGFADLPGGRAWYAHAVRSTTTTILTPDAIYELGMAEVARIRGRIQTLQAEIAAAGDPELPRYRSVEELVQAYTALRSSVESALPQMFGRFPRAGFEVRAIEPFRERSMPSSYEAASIDGSRPGVFYLNAAGVRGGGTAAVSRSLFLHEAIPGHHFQIALQRETPGLPGFRLFSWYPAFVEGWALYAEGLGEELDLYPSRRDRLGMLFGELFRANRLVVDVGIHERGWSRERAVEFLGGNRASAELEVARYMAWPGQALAYKIGELTIRRLRARAQTELGAAFDLRAFHDELLRDGAMPLSILDAKMDRWVAARKSGR